MHPRNVREAWRIVKAGWFIGSLEVRGIHAEEGGFSNEANIPGLAHELAEFAVWARPRHQQLAKTPPTVGQFFAFGRAVPHVYERFTLYDFDNDLTMGSVLSMTATRVDELTSMMCRAVGLKNTPPTLMERKVIAIGPMARAASTPDIEVP